MTFLKYQLLSSPTPKKQLKKKNCTELFTTAFSYKKAQTRHVSDLWYAFLVSSRCVLKQLALLASSVSPHHLQPRKTSYQRIQEKDLIC